MKINLNKIIQYLKNELYILREAIKTDNDWEAAGRRGEYNDLLYFIQQLEIIEQQGIKDRELLDLFSRGYLWTIR